MGTQLTPQRGTVANFWPVSIVAKRSPVSATAEHLFIKTYVPSNNDSVLINLREVIRD